MRAVGVRELKANLSRFLREVRQGEVILVTDRGQVVAELRAPGGPHRDQSRLDRALRQLADQGGLRVGEPHDPAPYVASPVHAPDGTARALLSEDRAEG